MVISGAGAAAVACGKFFKSLGVNHLLMVDSKGVIHDGRSDLNPQKALFAAKTERRSLAEAMTDADVFVGLSRGGLLTKAMVASMAPNPIIFAMANPTPEITPEEVADVRDDAIMATGRSDYPNQINNVLGFPFIFRGALDVRAKGINEKMKIAAAKALADLAKEPMPDAVAQAYGGTLTFGRHYILPKPMDQRLLTTVAPAVADAAVESGIARVSSWNREKYISVLKTRMGTSLMHNPQARPAD